MVLTIHLKLNLTDILEYIEKKSEWDYNFGRSFNFSYGWDMESLQIFLQS